MVINVLKTRILLKGLMTGYTDLPNNQNSVVMHINERKSPDKTTRVLTESGSKTNVMLFKHDPGIASLFLMVRGGKIIARF